MARIKGSNHNDKLSGTKHSDTILGRGGHDKMSGGSGNDWMFGGSGNDWMFGGSGHDKMFGGSGDNKMFGGSGNDWMFGGSGHNKMFGGSGNDWIFGGSGHDKIDGGSGNDRIDGGRGNDFLDGGASNDVVKGGKGNDTANYNMAENLGPDFDDIGTHDFYYGGRGHDTLQLTLTYGEVQDASVQQDIAKYQAFLTDHANPWSHYGSTFNFASFDLDARGFEALAVELVNAGPTANDDMGETDEDTLLASAGLLANDTDPDHLDQLTVVDFDAVSSLGAAVVVNPDGSYTYDPISALALQMLAVGENVTDSFGYTIADLAGATHAAMVNLLVTGVNDTPVITSNSGGDLAAVDVDENTTAVMTVVATDIDNGHVLSFMIAGGADAAKFSIAADTGVLIFLAAPDFEISTDADVDNVYSVMVEVSDEHGATDLQSIAVTIADVNEQPAAGGDFSATWAENVTDTTVLADVNATDPDAGGGNDADNDFENLIYSIFAGDDAGLFEINSDTGEVSLANGSMLDFETTLQHVLTVRATDGPGLVDDADVTINVTDVNEQPDAGADFAVSAAENVTDTVVLADVDASDPDAGGGNDADNDFEDLTYSIFAGNDAGLFEIDPATGEISLGSGQMLDFATAPQHVLTVRATDGPGLFDDVGVTINVTGNNPPVAVNDNVITNADFASTVIPEWALLANDSDPDGNPIDVTNVSEVPGFVTHTEGIANKGFVEFFVMLPGMVGPDEFTYAATDEPAEAVSALATVSVSQDLDGILTGTPDDDILVAFLAGSASLNGNGGNDVLIGGNDPDTLDGGKDNDIHFGGLGMDVFQFSFKFNPDVTSDDGFDDILDFNFGEDKLEFNGVTEDDFLSSFKVDHANDVTGDGMDDTVITIKDFNDWSVTLSGVFGHELEDFAGDSIFS